jgi:hypothetical protein
MRQIAACKRTFINSGFYIQEMREYIACIRLKWQSCDMTKTACILQNAQEPLPQYQIQLSHHILIVCIIRVDIYIKLD